MISPLDERYYGLVKELEIFSEKNYFKKRAEFELRWYNFLADIFKFKKKKSIKIGENEFKEFKRIEQKTKHDVKAVEYFLRKRVKEKWAVHLFLTSDDTNNIAYALMLKEYKEKVFPFYKKLVKEMIKVKGGKMPSFTHGKKAVPTRFERLAVFHAYRISLQYKKLKEFKLKGKITGASGDFNSFSLFNKSFSFWRAKLRKFVKSLGLEYEEFSTQVMRGEHYSDFFSIILNINNILIDLSEDLWLLSFRGYLKLKVKRVGSSTMPHKVNPIELENAIGNLRISNSLLSVMINSFPVSKLHRDISDSTIKRNTGVCLAHSLLAVKMIYNFIKKVEFDENKAKKDIGDELLSEALQIKLRINKVDNAYERVKSLYDKGDKEKIKEMLREEGIKEYEGFSKQLIEEMKKEILKNIKS